MDGGETLDGPILITTRTAAPTLSSFPGSFDYYMFNYLAVSPVDGTVYVVYEDITNVIGGNDNVDIWFTKSTDQGQTWTTPVVINTDSNPPGDQFYPWIEVDIQGNLHMLFYNTKDTPQNDSGTSSAHGYIDAYYAFSGDGGATWSEYRLTPTSFDSDNDGLNRPYQFIGHYQGLAHGYCTAYPCYVSTQEGDSNIYTHRIEVRAACCLPDTSCVETFPSTCEHWDGILKCQYRTCAQVPYCPGQYGPQC